MVHPQLVSEPAGVEDFERLYRENEDPWGYRESWYERRKYAMTLALLPRERYRTVWEPACSIGVLTRQLAARADRVFAEDGSATAIAVAERDGTPPGVTWAARRLPGPAPVPAGGADLVVLSEILYYLGPDDRAELMTAAATALAPGGDLVAVHWRPQAHDAHTSGAEVHARLQTAAGWTHLATYEDGDFLADVLRRA